MNETEIQQEKIRQYSELLDEGIIEPYQWEKLYERCLEINQNEVANWIKENAL